MREMWDKMNAFEQPGRREIDLYVGSPLWNELCDFIEQSYQIKPIFEFSKCCVTGWNVKYRKAGRALTTLYPMKGYLIALVVIGERERQEIELLLPTMSSYLQTLYRETKTGMGQKWLMVEVRDWQVLADIKKCLAVRRTPDKSMENCRSIEKKR